jgi:hypothetical protein
VGCGDGTGPRADAAQTDAAQDASDASGADAGDHDVFGGDSTLAGPCVDISHVGAMQTLDLEVIGTGFAGDEGQMIRVVVTLGSPTYGLGEAPIRDAAFDIYLPHVLGDYTGIAVYVDRTRNDACDPDQEVMWQVTTGPASALGPGFTKVDGHVVWAVTPASLRVSNIVPPCILNGIFDVSTTLACAH